MPLPVERRCHIASQLLQPPSVDRLPNVRAVLNPAGLQLETTDSVVDVHTVRAARPEEQRELTHLYLCAIPHAGNDNAFIDRSMSPLAITLPLIKCGLCSSGTGNLRLRRRRRLAEFPEMYSSGRIFRLLRLREIEGTRMKKTIALGALALSLISSVAMADERRGSDAALGALSGALVLGPFGAVAGAVVGYTAGPSIARSWGFRRSSSTSHRGRTSATQEERVSAVDSQPVPNRQTVPLPAAQAPQTPPPSPKSASTTPPVQGLE
jgi:hypothetical protein